MFIKKTVTFLNKILDIMMIKNLAKLKVIAIIEVNIKVLDIAYVI